MRSSWDDDHDDLVFVVFVTPRSWCYLGAERVVEVWTIHFHGEVNIPSPSERVSVCVAMVRLMIA